MEIFRQRRRLKPAVWWRRTLKQAHAATLPAHTPRRARTPGITGAARRRGSTDQAARLPRSGSPTARSATAIDEHRVRFRAAIACHCAAAASVRPRGLPPGAIHLRSWWFRDSA